jgi:poly(hydroxyalkanoate) granule-associated protein
MARKLKELAQEGDGQLGVRIRDSATQIWLAGLGAFAKAQREGTRVFDALVEEGTAIQERTRKTAEEALGGLKARAAKSLDQLSWDQLERVFEERVERALHSLSVPTRKDLDTLSERVAELTAVTEKLSATMGGARPRARSTRASEGARRAA